jgi:hypothetical protein
MKKKIKKLNLSKRTISNLNNSEMNEKLGGVKPQTKGHTCIGNHTCFFCTW